LHPSPGTSTSHLPRSPCRLNPTTSTPGAPLPLCPCLVQTAHRSLPAASHHTPAVQPLRLAAPLVTILVTLPSLLSPQPNPHPSNPHTPPGPRSGFVQLIVSTLSGPSPLQLLARRVWKQSYSLQETPVSTCTSPFQAFSSIVLDPHNPFPLSLSISSYAIHIDRSIVLCPS